MQQASSDPEGQRSPQSAGGLARAESLTPTERTAIAKRAAQARWEDNDLPQTLFDGEFVIGETAITCAVLDDEDETRIITQAAFLRALGRARSPKVGTGVLSTVDDLPFFLQSKALRPFIDADLLEAAKPIRYRTKSGGTGIGYNATLLPKVADAYWQLREHYIASGIPIPVNQRNMLAVAVVLVRSFAAVGVIALVDEATGYQDVRARRALNAILERYIAKELQKWAKIFPDEFYKELFRLRNWRYDPSSVKRPGVIGKWTNDLVYERLAPKVLDELRTRNPVTVTGRRRYAHHQWLTDDVGHPRLKEHLSAVIALMRASNSWNEFKRLMDRSLPRHENVQLELFEEG